MKSNEAATNTAFEILKSTPDSNDFIERDVEAAKRDKTTDMIENKICDELKQPDVAVKIINQLLKGEIINSRVIAEKYLQL